MKKAQVLSAIALAFALGLTVVAPVANANAICSINAEVRETAEATEQEGANAVAYVERNATYSKIAAVVAAIEEYYTNPIVDGSIPVTVANIQLHMRNLDGQFVNGVSGDKISSTYNSGETNLGVLAENAAATTNFALYSQFIEEMAKTTDFKVSTVAEIVAQMRSKGIVASNFDLSTWGDTAATGITVTTKTAVQGALGYTAAGLTTDYTNIKNFGGYYTLVNDVNRITKYAEAYDAIAGAIAAAVDTTAGETASENNEKYTTTIYALYQEAVDANITGYTDWKDVYDAVKAVKADQSKANRYTMIVALATAWKKALPENDCLAAVIAEEMMGYIAPSNPGTGEGSNNGNDGEGEGDAAGDTDKTPEAGDTGVIAAADGTASSTVAIVAGIATALTAAGAGVVAYRNARRQEA